VDRALFGLARLALAPENPSRDEREAARYLDRVLLEYPQSPLGAEARAWRELLRSLERLQRDVQRQQQDLQRLRRVLEHEQQEVARLQQERERLRQVDLEFERPLKGLTPTSAPTGPIPRE
jgi:chromosome segregation ATPase